MKYFSLLITFYFFGQISFGQNGGPKEITPEILQKIKSEIELKIPKLKETLSKKEVNPEEMEFSIDTFRIENIASKRIDIDYSTTGMNIAVLELTSSYDKLMNKYYNKLMKLLKPEDKKVLVTAQKAWLVFRDAETDLIGKMTEEQYSGGGTIQSNIRVGSYSSLVVSRTIEIFNYYNGIIKDQ